METNFKFTPAEKPEPIYFEQIFAEKPAGGLVANPTFDILPSTAVGFSEGKFKPIKAYRLVAAVTTDDTTIKIAKGSGIAVGDIIAHGKKGVACTAIDQSNADYDLVTVTLATAIPNDTVLYQAKAASADAVGTPGQDGYKPAVLAEPIYQPLYVVGNTVPANEGDFPIRLVNGANLRKETANIASEVAALLPTITLV